MSRFGVSGDKTDRFFVKHLYSIASAVCGCHCGTIHQSHLVIGTTVSTTRRHQKPTTAIHGELEAKMAANL